MNETNLHDCRMIFFTVFKKIRIWINELVKKLFGKNINFKLRRLGRFKITDKQHQNGETELRFRIMDLSRILFWGDQNFHHDTLPVLLSK